MDGTLCARGSTAPQALWIERSMRQVSAEAEAEVLRSKLRVLIASLLTSSERKDEQAMRATLWSQQPIFAFQLSALVSLS